MQNCTIATSEEALKALNKSLQKVRLPDLLKPAFEHEDLDLSHLRRFRLTSPIWVDLTKNSLIGYATLVFSKTADSRYQFSLDSEFIPQQSLLTIDGFAEVLHTAKYQTLKNIPEHTPMQSL